RTKRRHKYLSDAIGLLVFSENCDANFTGIFGVHDTAVLLDSNLLAADAFDLEKRKALDSFASAFLISSKFERFEDRFNLLHHRSSSYFASAGALGGADCCAGAASLAGSFFSGAGGSGVAFPNCRSSARLTNSTLTLGSPKMPRVLSSTLA